MDPQQPNLDVEEADPDGIENAPPVGDEAAHPESDSPAVEQTSPESSPSVIVGTDASDVEDLHLFTVPWTVGAGVLGLLLVIMGVWRWFRRPRMLPRSDDPVGETEGVVVSNDANLQPVATEGPGLGDRLRERMTKTRAALQGRLDELFGRDVVGTEILDELEEVLLVADVGIETTDRLVSLVRARLGSGPADAEDLRVSLREEMKAILASVDPLLAPPADVRPWVILVVGVNGSGKTTSIGKLAARFQREGKRVLVAAGDTFRAAAVEQLEIWAQRSGADFVSLKEGADPGAVVYQALDTALANQHDVVIIDTAGRLQTRKPLMQQLSKVRRIIERKVPGGPHETLLVVDGTMGQNAMSQARSFHESTPLTGVVVTKLDGTAKGGMVLNIVWEMQLPVKLIGIGEQIDDLRDFESDAFIDALA